MAPTTPIAPASVGVARPMKMVPSTMKISASEGTMPRDASSTAAASRAACALPAASAGTSCGRTMLRMKTQPANSSTWTMLAPVAPIYMSPGELPSWSASTISTSEGGMSWVMVPDAAMTPVAWRTL